ncbi:hypothetical protein GCM10008910_23610 [Faecalicatena orotica]
MRILNYYNADYGKRIFGFEETAMDELKKYPWPGNITQLSQIISLLVMQTKDLYISNQCNVTNRVKKKQWRMLQEN